MSKDTLLISVDYVLETLFLMLDIILRKITIHDFKIKYIFKLSVNKFQINETLNN